MKLVSHIRRPLTDFKDAKGNWKEVDEWPHHKMVVVCRNPDCKAYNVEHDVDVPANVDGEIRSVCGPCKRETEVWAPTTDAYANQEKGRQSNHSSPIRDEKRT